MSIWKRELKKALWLTTAIFFILQLLNIIYPNSTNCREKIWGSIGFTFMYTLSLYFVNSALFKYFNARFQDHLYTPKRIAIRLVVSLSVSVFVIMLLRMIEDMGMKGYSWSYFWEHERMANYVVALVITIIVTLTMYAIYIYKAYHDNLVKQQAVKATTASAQFESLKNQIDPHFLFNSLNVLTALIEENPTAAQRFTTSLSRIYRYVLDQKDKQWVPLHEELAFATTYVKLLEMRFENSIQFDMTIHQEHTDWYIVPLSLQLLLENAVKHNVVSSQKPLHIKLYINDHQLVVENVLQRKELNQDRKGVGLSNIIQRYQLLTPRKVLILQTQTMFSVQLPLLTEAEALHPHLVVDEQMLFDRAQKRVQKLREFYGNALAFGLVMPLLIWLNLSDSNDAHWFWFPLIGWGSGLLFQGIDVLDLGTQWEEKALKKWMKNYKTSHS